MNFEFLRSYENVELHKRANKLWNQKFCYLLVEDLNELCEQILQLLPISQKTTSTEAKRPPHQQDSFTNYTIATSNYTSKPKTRNMKTCIT